MRKSNKLISFNEEADLLPAAPGNDQGREAALPGKPGFPCIFMLGVKLEYPSPRDNFLVRFG